MTASALSEFGLIQRFFTPSKQRPDVLLGGGDDCALLQVPPGQALAVSIDTLVEGVHFLAGTDPYAIGWKTLAVSLSDLAAMGAEPAWATLALTLPAADPEWLRGFSSGLYAVADRYHVSLVGGDTTRGPLCISLQAHGLVEPDAALRRSGARPGDLIFVTGSLGDAALALRLRQSNRQCLPSKQQETLDARLDRPQPRVEVGLALRGRASAAIDISDGLRADLGHILAASGVGARIHLDDLPLSSALRACCDEAEALQYALVGGDDYELCFTVPPQRESELVERLARLPELCTCIGRIEQAPGLRLVGDEVDSVGAGEGYRHF